MPTAGRDADADRLLTDYAWIKAKLTASDAQDLFADYLPEPSEHSAQLVGRAIALSIPMLTVNPRELPLQLFGQLGNIEYPAVVALVATAREDTDFHPAPRWPGLVPPGAERLRLAGHEGGVNSAAFSPDGSLIITASTDGTARVWNAISGQELSVLRGHESEITAAAFSPNRFRVVTASGDGTARLWDVATGVEVVVLRRHEGGVTSVAFSPDGGRIATASRDRTARLWDVTGTEIAMFCGHWGRVNSVAFSP